MGILQVKTIQSGNFVWKYYGIYSICELKNGRGSYFLANRLTFIIDLAFSIFYTLHDFVSLICAQTLTKCQ